MVALRIFRHNNKESHESEQPSETKGGADVKPLNTDTHFETSQNLAGTGMLGCEQMHLGSGYPS